MVELTPLSSYSSCGQHTCPRCPNASGSAIICVKVSNVGAGLLGDVGGVEAGGVVVASARTAGIGPSDLVKSVDPV